MNKLAITLKKFRESRNLTIIQLAELAGTGKGTIGDIETGKNKSTIKTLEKISKALKLSESEREELFSAFVPKDIGEKITGRKDAFNLEKSKVNTVLLPVYGGASAGNGYLNLENEIYFMAVKKGNFSKDSFLVEIHGESMEPTLTDGDFALVDPNNIDYEKNKIYVVTYNDESFIKRIFDDVKNEMIILKSDNPDYDDIYISYEERDYVKVEGRVIEVIRKIKL